MLGKIPMQESKITKGRVNNAYQEQGYILSIILVAA